MQKVWKLKEEKEVSKELIDAAGSKFLAKILKSRGIDSAQKIETFLNPLSMQITEPEAFSDIKKIVDRIKIAIAKDECITVYGDFDVDGITSTSVLYKTLKEIGAKVDYYLPDRESESHGLNTKALINIISKKKSKLIITVDCGISDVNEVNFAKSFNADVIITDHHEAPEELPKAFAILNPKAKNSLVETLNVEELESLNYLAGVGVAFKLCCALLYEFSKTDFVDELLPLVAVGTVADIVPLIGENRCFVQMGLLLLRKEKNLGLTKLLKSAGIDDLEKVNSETIAFSIAPRLNAAGRLTNAYNAIKLLVSDDSKIIDECVEELNQLNSERQDLCEITYQEAVSMVEKEQNIHTHSITLYKSDWHIGIIGIVASKLIEKYNKPVFLMTQDPNEESVFRCSCRSIKGINVYEVLNVHSDLFLGFGGHSMAAGFSFDRKTISFKNFRKLLNETIEEASENAPIEPTLDIDMVVSPEDVNYQIIDEIEKLQPFGAKNPPPVFALTKLKLSQYKMMGQNANHLKMFVQGESSQVFECVKWNYPDFNVPLNSVLDIAFYPKINSFNGRTTIQLDIKDIRSEFIKEKKDSGLKFFDHRKKTDILTQVLDYLNTSSKKIALFIENRATQETVKQGISQDDIIFNRMDIPQEVDQIMLFDCPPSQEIFNKIVASSNAKAIHLMNFKSFAHSAEDFIKVISGMLKYSDKNRGGNIVIEELAKATNTTNQAIELAIAILVEAGAIKINEHDESSANIEFISAVELQKLKQLDMFKELQKELSNISDFCKKIHTCQVEEIKKILN